MRANIHLNPQMPFYPKDFLANITFLTDTQAIRYLKILCNMYIHGRLTEKQMICICGEYDNEVFDMFDIDDEGKYYDEKLEYEIMKREEYQNKSVSKRRSRTPIRSAQQVKSDSAAVKKPYGSEGNVLLTDREYGMLKDKLGNETESKIEALGLYIKSKGKDYESHYATIMSWELNNEIRKREERVKTRDYSDLEEMSAKYD